MQNHPWRAFLPLYSLLASGSLAAAPVSMKLPAELQAVQPQAVHGRTGNLWRNPLRFAGWQATAPSTFDASGWALAAASGNEEKRLNVESVAFEFGIRAEGSSSGESRHRCLARFRSATHSEVRGRVSDETSIELAGYPRVDCELPGPRPGHLSLHRDAGSQRDSGELRFGERVWDLRSVNNLATQRSSLPMGRFGYELRMDGVAMAAVETVNQGRVWLDPKLDAADRPELAAAIAALLSYSVLLETRDE